jgi:hypothetical protein
MLDEINLAHSAGTQQTDDLEARELCACRQWHARIVPIRVG